MSDVLIIGDSISVGYTPHAAEALGEGFTVTHNAGNAGTSTNLLAHLDEYLAAAPEASILQFNTGLHGLKRPDGGEMAETLDVYRENLRQIVDRLAACDATAIWANTTPVHDGRHEATHEEFTRREADVAACNAAAAEIVDAAGIVTNDLHAFVVANGVDRCIRDDGVHMTEDAYVRLGKHVAEFIREAS